MNITALTLTTLAGLSSLFGYLIIYIKGDNEKIIASSLGLAAGVMIFISVIDLLPNSLTYFKLSFYSIFSYIFWILFFIIGILISITLNDYTIYNKGNLYKVGVVSFITLIIHNIPEGIITYLTTTIELKTGILLALSIGLHNIPEGISIAIPIYYATRNKFKALVYVLIASLSEPFGALLAFLFIKGQLSSMLLGILYSIVAGIMVSVSSVELLPEAKTYSNKYTYIFFLLGIVVIYISHLLL